MKKFQKGFTLVELSIVLVIIGLLIGGILVAQSLIDSVKIQSFVRQIQQYDIAISNFKLNFRCLPGDANCDGAIYSQYNNDTSWNGEIPQVWKQLSERDYIQDGTIYTTSHLVDIGYPSIEIGEDCGAVVSSADNANGGSNQIYAAWGTDPFYSIKNHNDTLSAGSSLNPHDPCVSAADSYTIDKKIDDGIGNTGNVIATGFIQNDLAGYAAGGDARDDTDCFVDGSYLYNAGDEDGKCGLQIKLNAY